MCCRPTDHAANRNDGVVAASKRHFFCSDGKLKRSRNVHYIHIPISYVRSPKCLESACEQPVGDKTIESADGNPKAQSRSVQTPLDRRLNFLPCRHFTCPENSPGASPKMPRSFTHIFRGAAHSEKCGFQKQGFFLRHFRATLDRFHAVFHGQWSLLDDLFGHRFRRG